MARIKDENLPAWRKAFKADGLPSVKESVSFKQGDKTLTTEYEPLSIPDLQSAVAAFGSVENVLAAAISAINAVRLTSAKNAVKEAAPFDYATALKKRTSEVMAEWRNAKPGRENATPSDAAMAAITALATARANADKAKNEAKSLGLDAD